MLPLHNLGCTTQVYQPNLGLTNEVVTLHEVEVRTSRASTAHRL